jgi:endoglucanase
MINTSLLKTICETPGAPGFEYRIRNLVMKTIADYVDEMTVDPMGNLIAIKRGKTDKKLMVAAHMDEIGFIVTHVDDDGFIRFETLGGFDPKTLTAQRVIIHGKEDIIGVMGTKPIHIMTPEERKTQVKIRDFYIDTGLSGEKVKELVSIGDPITRKRSLIEMGDCVNSKSLDNRLSVFILAETLRLLKDVKIPYDFYAVFTVQEEIGVRGAIKAAHLINPDFGLALDVTIANDLPGAQPHEQITKLGKGTAIKVMDAMTLCDYRMVRYLKELADKHSIPWQAEVFAGGGTDAAGIQRYGKNGAISGGVSIPTRHIHQVIEMAHKSDIKYSIDLLIETVKEMDNFNWAHD